MATLEFKKVSDSQFATAKESNSLGKGVSPFQDGVKFEVEKFDFRILSGKTDAKPIPVLVTPIGDLFVKSLIRGVVDKDGKILEHKGTFNTKVRDIIAQNSSKNDGEILALIVEACKDRKIITRRVSYAKEIDKFSFPASFLEFDFVVS